LKSQFACTSCVRQRTCAQRQVKEIRAVLEWCVVACHPRRGCCDSTCLAEDVRARKGDDSRWTGTPTSNGPAWRLAKRGVCSMRTLLPCGETTSSYERGVRARLVVMKHILAPIAVVAAAWWCWLGSGGGLLASPRRGQSRSPLLLGVAVVNMWHRRSHSDSGAAERRSWAQPPPIHSGTNQSKAVMSVAAPLGLGGACSLHACATSMGPSACHKGAPAFGTHHPVFNGILSVCQSSGPCTGRNEGSLQLE